MKRKLKCKNKNKNQVHCQWSWQYPCLTNVIATFHSLNISSIFISEYSSIILMILACIFFFNTKITCNLFVSACMASTSNSIMKSTIFFFSYLKVLIFHSAFIALVLSLNIFFISCTKLFQFWILISLSSLLSFF